MDAGAATFFLADVVGTRFDGRGEVMTSDYFRGNLPEDVRRAYESRLETAQEELEAFGRDVASGDVWPGPVVEP